MIKIKEVVIVEGKYDKIKVQSVIDAPIITTEGFGIFKDKEKQKLIRKLAEERGILVLTDSDSAGFLIRKFIRGSIPKEQVRHAYIPDLFGKEKRKTEVSAEGKLGVEGMPIEIIEEALKKAGISCSDDTESRMITKTDLFTDGFYGTAGCNEKRLALLKKLDLPERMTPNALLEMINVFLSYEEYRKIAAEMRGFK